MAAHPDTQSAYAIMDIEQPLKLRYAKSLLPLSVQTQHKFNASSCRHVNEDNHEIISIFQANNATFPFAVKTVRRSIEVRSVKAVLRKFSADYSDT